MLSRCWIGWDAAAAAGTAAAAAAAAAAGGSPAARRPGPLLGSTTSRSPRHDSTIKASELRTCSK